MAYDAESLRTAVRNMFQNLPEDIIGDDVLDTFLMAGLRRFSSDHPNETLIDLADVTSSGYFDMSTKSTIWENGFSVVRGMANQVDMTTARELEWLREGIDWRFNQYGEVAQVWVANNPGSLGMLSRITYPWRIIGVGDDWYGETLVTTVPYRWMNAVELACAIEMARARGANMAGKMTSGFQADVVDWRSKSREYLNQAREWERVYYRLLGHQVSGGPPPVMVAFEYDPQRHQDGSYPLTHGDPW